MHKTDKNIYRASNLELLRIFSMVFIIMHHYFVHGNFQLENTEVHLPLVWVQLISILGKLGVNCFILITGYFMVTSKFKLLSILKIIIEVIFYSITITFVIYGLGIMDVNLNVLLMSILPIHFEMYWFATTYIVLYILTPFLNIFIKNISKRQLIKLILVLIILWSIFPMIVMPAVSFSVLGWFILVYFIAAYIRLSNSSFEKNWSYYLKLFCFLYVLLIMSVLLFDLCSIKFTFLRAYATYYSGMNRFIVLLMSISLFLTFKNLNIKYNRLINNIATTIFGVYLIHDHVLMRDFFMEDFI